MLAESTCIFLREEIDEDHCPRCSKAKSDHLTEETFEQWMNTQRAELEARKVELKKVEIEAEVKSVELQKGLQMQNAASLPCNWSHFFLFRVSCLLYVFYCTIDFCKRVTYLLDELHRKVDTKLSKSSGSYTDHGHAIHTSLEYSAKIRKVLGEVGPAIFPSEFVDKIDELINQNTKRPHFQYLVALYSATLREIVAEVNPHVRLVNTYSDLFAPLPCLSDDRPSDIDSVLISSFHGLYRFNLPCKTPQICWDGLFGKFESWKSRSSIHCIWYCKWKLDMTAFGEICKYLQNATKGAADCYGAPLWLKGILFDYQELWMISSAGNAIVDVVKCNWSQPGSKQLLLEFLQVFDPWIDAVNALCEQWNVSIMDYSSTQQYQSALLGAGENGRVFKLNDGSVMKVVVGKNSKHVENEYKLSLQCQQDDALKLLVFPIIQDSFHSGTIDNVTYAGYRLIAEGENVTLPLSKAKMVELAQLLYGLHASGVIHGDPRIDNILILDGSIKWIDFRDVDPVTKMLGFSRDVKILCESLMCASIEHVEIDIEAYAATPSPERLCKILAKICVIM